VAVITGAGSASEERRRCSSQRKAQPSWREFTRQTARAFAVIDHGVSCDVTCDADTARLFGATVDLHGGLDI